jgi:hypothetical protein
LTGPTGPQGPPGAASTVPGPPGVDGNTVLYGAANPTNGQGVNGNFYINTTSEALFGPKAAGAWPAGTSMIGPQGAAGPQGATGPTGPTGPQGPAGADGAGAPATVPPIMDSTAAVGTSLLFARQDHVHPSDTSRVAKAGDTMTGDLTISKATPSLLLNKTASGQDTQIIGRLNGNGRWLIDLGNSTAETATDGVGSDFSISRCNNAGGVAGTPMTISRQTGAVNFSSNMATAGAFTAATDLNATNGSVYVPNGNFYGSGVVLNQNASFTSSTTQTFLQTNPSCYFLYDKGTGNLTWGVNGASQFLVVYTLYFQITVPTAYKPGGGAWTDSSDARIKNVIGEYQNGLDEVVKLRPIVYTFKGNDTPEPPGHMAAPEGTPVNKEPITVPYPNSPHRQVAIDKRPFVGLIAQEVDPVFPGAVTKRNGYIDGKPVDDLLDLDTTPLVFALINAVKELAARLEALEGKPP